MKLHTSYGKTNPLGHRFGYDPIELTPCLVWCSNSFWLNFHRFSEVRILSIRWLGYYIDFVFSYPTKTRN